MGQSSSSRFGSRRRTVTEDSDTSFSSLTASAHAGSSSMSSEQSSQVDGDSTASQLQQDQIGMEAATFDEEMPSQVSSNSARSIAVDLSPAGPASVPSWPPSPSSLALVGDMVPECITSSSQTSTLKLDPLDTLELESSALATSSTPSSPGRCRGPTPRFKNRRLSRQSCDFFASPITTSSDVAHSRSSLASTPAGRTEILHLSQGTSETYVPGLVPRTPEEERDAMLEERRQARDIIEAALAQTRIDLEHSLPSTSAVPYSTLIPADQIIDTVDSHSNQGDQSEYLDPCDNADRMSETFPQSASRPPERSVVSTCFDSQYTSTRPVIVGNPNPSPRAVPLQTPHDRTFAPLPRRGASRSPSPSPSSHYQGAVMELDPTPGNAEDSPASEPIFPPVVPALLDDNVSAPNTSPPMLIPRRILVQGIVARSPPISPVSASRPRNSAASGVRTGFSSENESEFADSGFWDELPMGGMTADEPRSSETETGENASFGTGNDASWNNVVRELLALPDGRSETLAAEESQVPADTDTAANDVDSQEGLNHQANLIGRLLSIAAAATAATLLPGTISVNGAQISGFDDVDTLANPSARSISSAQLTEPSTAFASPSRLRSNSTGAIRERNTRATTTAENEVIANSSGSNTGNLQDMIRNALVAAFRTPPSSPPANSTSSTTLDTASPLQSSLSQTSSLNSSSPLRGSSLPNMPAAGPPGEASSFLPSGPAQSDSDGFATSTPAEGSALAVPIRSMQIDSRLSRGSGPPENTFEEFLADLQTDVSAAIVRSQATPADDPPTGNTDFQQVTTANVDESRPLLSQVDSAIPSEDRHLSLTDMPTPNALHSRRRTPFTFFRAYRFPSRSLANVLSQAPLPNTAPMATSTAINSSEPVSSGSDTISGSHTMASEGSATTTISGNLDSGPSLPANGAAVGATTHTSSGPRLDIVPMLLVGVRSLTGPPPVTSTHGGEHGGHRTGSENSSAAVSAIPVSLGTDGDTEMSDVAVESANSIEGPQPSSDPPVHNFILWIMGGLYPSNHPIVLAPSLLGDDALSYEDMLRLAEVMGQHKPPTVSPEEIAKADLQVIKGEQVSKYVEEGRVLLITSERCLVCLEDYEPEDDVRILACSHCFHQNCVDRWLSQGANTCPACRKAGVRKEVIPTTAASSVPIAQDQQEPQPISAI